MVSRVVLDKPLCLNGKQFARIWHAQQFNSIICFAFVRIESWHIFIRATPSAAIAQIVKSFIYYFCYSIREHLTRRWQPSSKSILLSLHSTNCFNSIRRADAEVEMHFSVFIPLQRLLVLINLRLLFFGGFLCVLRKYTGRSRKCSAIFVSIWALHEWK